MDLKAKQRPGNGPVAAVGRFSFRHRWTVLAVWLVVAAGGFMVTGQVFDGLSSNQGGAALESIQGYQVLDKESTAGGTVIGEVKNIDPASAGVKTAVDAAATDLAAVPSVRGVVTPFTAGLPPAQVTALTARTGDGVLVTVSMTKLTDDARKASVDAITAKLDALQVALRASDPDATVLIGGGAVLGPQVNNQVQSDLGLAEELSLPITLVVLVFVFGGLVVAGLPVIAAILSVFAAMAALLGFEHVTKLDQNATIVVTLLGLGLSIDYGLLLVARYREELAAGHDAPDALSRAWAAAGRTIVFSALTVAGSLAGLVVFGVTSMTALGVAGVSIATIAMTVSLTATAALIGVFRRRIRPRRRKAAAHAAGATGPAQADANGGDDDRGFFAGLARVVQRRPVVTVVVTGGLLLAAGLPIASAKTSVDSLSSLPTSLSAVRVAHDLQDNYGRSDSPAVIVIARTDPATLDAWAARWRSTPGVTEVGQADLVGPKLSTVEIYRTGDPEDGAARDFAKAVRADRPAGAQSWVAGDAALLDDILGLIGDRLPWAVGVTAIAMLILLFLMTGSLVVPIKAILMNTLSLGATVGVMALVFQHGYGSGVLHTLTTGSLDPFVVVGVLAFAFGLSMDYEVFLLSRIKEYVDAGLPSDVAVRRGLQRSGRVITSAALLMVIVFGCFLVGRVGNTQQIGLGLASAIAIDATLVRCVLVPATMTLLGKWNWWAPRPLARWHAKWVAPKVVEEPQPELEYAH